MQEIWIRQQILDETYIYLQAHFTLGVEAKGRGISRDPIGLELKDNPQSFTRSQGQQLVEYSNVGLEMTPNAQKKPSCIWGGNKGP